MRNAKRVKVYLLLGLLVLTVSAVALVLNTNMGAENRRPTEAANLLPTPTNTASSTDEREQITSVASVVSMASTPILHTFPTVAPSNPVSQTVQGYTVTVYPLYADANVIVLTYTVMNPNLGPYATPFAPLPGTYEGGVSPGTTLRDNRGHEFAESYIRPGESLGNGIGFVAFDSSQLGDLPTLPDMLHLHFVLDRAVLSRPRVEGGFDGQFVPGVFIFDFSMPVDPVRRVVHVNQTATINDGRVFTLDKVLVTRRVTRIFSHVSDSSASPSSASTLIGGAPWSCCHLKLQVGNWSSEQVETKSWNDTFPDAPLIDAQGEWTVSTWYVYTGNAFYEPAPGPVFHFTVPLLQ